MRLIIMVARYHIGESLLPSIRQFLQLIDAESMMEARGFTPKVRAVEISWILILMLRFLTSLVLRSS